MTDSDGENNGLEYLLDKAFEQNNGLTCTLGTTIINEIEQFEMEA
jgi:hypothetical protein